MADALWLLLTVVGPILLAALAAFAILIHRQDIRPGNRERDRLLLEQALREDAQGHRLETRF